MGEKKIRKKSEERKKKGKGKKRSKKKRERKREKKRGTQKKEERRKKGKKGTKQTLLYKRRREISSLTKVFRNKGNGGTSSHNKSVLLVPNLFENKHVKNWKILWEKIRRGGKKMRKEA